MAGEAAQLLDEWKRKLKNQSQTGGNLPVEEFSRERDVSECRVQIVINDLFAAPPSRTRSG
jgi:hypothetical protein